MNAQKTEITVTVTDGILGHDSQQPTLLNAAMTISRRQRRRNRLRRLH